jgi:hypothetical protein
LVSDTPLENLLLEIINLLFGGLDLLFERLG